MANLLDPQGIIIGHEGAFLPAVYLQQLESTVNDKILAAGYQHITVGAFRLWAAAPRWWAASAAYFRNCSTADCSAKTKKIGDV